MDELSKEYLISFYDKRLLLHGDRSEAVGWSSAGQISRYQTLLEAGDITDTRVLDFGCGKGDLCGFLRDRGIRAGYTGFDINEKLIILARHKYPGVDFRVFDIDKDVLNEDFDYIFLCGVFNLKVEGIDETARNTLKELFRHCTKTLAFNAISAHEPKKDFQLHYMSPEEMLDFAATLSPHVTVSYDKTSYDFTIFVRKPGSQGMISRFNPAITP